MIEFYAHESYSLTHCDSLTPLTCPKKLDFFYKSVQLSHGFSYFAICYSYRLTAINSPKNKAGSFQRVAHIFDSNRHNKSLYSGGLYTTDIDLKVKYQSQPEHNVNAKLDTT